MSVTRILKHLIAPDWLIHRVFPRAALKRIEAATARSEAAHRGELCCAVEAGFDLLPLLRGVTPRARALEVFSRLRVWDTAENSGVLIYVQLVDRDIEIVADRGIGAKVGLAQWEAICRRIEHEFRERRFEQGVLDGIQEITAVLASHFPARGADANELPDPPVVL
jgi:hypothetical protein